MRVIAGVSRGKRLATFKGHNVRPTPDRVREALFSILQSRLGSFAGLKVLDLFSGSGALAIEALSRGAASASMVEKAEASLKIIKENLDLCRMSDRASLVAGDAVKAIATFAPDTFDLVFLDPPYGQGLAEAAILQIARSSVLKNDGILCAETGATEKLPASAGELRQIDQRRYGSIMISLYGYQPNEGQIND